MSTIRTALFVTVFATLTLLGALTAAGSLVSHYLQPRPVPVELNHPTHAGYLGNGQGVTGKQYAGYLGNGQGVVGIPYGTDATAAPQPPRGGNGGDGRQTRADRA
jgi:hypothetical protein